jgi:hypothetical protein
LRVGSHNSRRSYNEIMERKYIMSQWLFASVLLLVLLMCLVISVAFNTVANYSRYTAPFFGTYTAIVATNNFVETAVSACSVICEATGNKVSCNQSYCPKAWTNTPTPLPIDYPTPNPTQAAKTNIQRTQAPIITVIAVCTSFYKDSASLCPHQWLESLTPAK